MNLIMVYMYINKIMYIQFNINQFFMVIIHYQYTFLVVPIILVIFLLIILHLYLLYMQNLLLQFIMSPLVHYYVIKLYLMVLFMHDINFIYV